MRRTKFYRKTLILSVSILLLLTIVFSSKPTLAQEENYCTRPGAVAGFNQISLVGAGLSWLGVAANINDNNTGTYIGFGNFGNNGYRGEYEGIVTFGSTVPEITRVEYEQYGVTDARTRSNTTITYLLIGGAWQQIDSHTSRGTISRVINGPWNNVDGVKVYVRATFDAACRKAEGCAFQWILRELRAFGPAAPTYQDIGLRVFNSTETVVIAAEPTGTLTSLRIAKNEVIYGIALIDPTDPEYGNPQYDSGVRIQTSSGIKALRKL